MWRYFELLSFKSLEEIAQLKHDVDNGANPRDIKIIFAKEIIERFHGAEAAANAHKGAGNIIREGEIPADCPEVTVEIGDQVEVPISFVINQAKLVASGAAGRDMLKNGRVKVDWEVVPADHKLSKGNYLIQAGKKKIAKVTLG